jgi:hypothetical protein
MKKQFFSLFAASVVLGLVACNGNGDNQAAADSLTTDSSTVTTTASGDYAAKADSIRINSEQGVYLNPKTGKPVKLHMDVSTGAVTNAETGEPVWRYVDRRNWWVYGGEDWNQIGEAKMDNDKLVYKTDDDRWVTYDERWSTEDVKLEKDWKAKYGDTKIKVGKDGDVKVKDESGKTKVDGKTGEVKKDSTH